jgi:hypothetical protein
MRGGFVLFVEWDVSSLGLTGDVGLELVGKEKLTDPLLPGLSTPVSSCTLDKLVTLDPFLLGAVAVVPGPRLDPRPVALLGGGEVMRAGGSRLAVRRCAAERERVMFFGIDGTGGASGALGTPRAGEGSRKVRSDIDPLLPRRSRVPFPGVPLTDPAFELAIDEFDPALRSILLVCTSPTDTGLVGRARNAAAAAEAERDALEAWLFKKAEAAAVAALALAVEEFKGCRKDCQRLLSRKIDAGSVYHHARQSAAMD